MGRVMAVYDVDPFYADRFADTVNQREKLPFTVMAFTTLERLKTYAKEHAVDLLLISSAVPKEEVEAIGAARVVTLVDGDTVPAEWEYPSIYKYQSSSDIVREVMACYCKDEAEPAVAVLGRAATVIGVYSPVGRCSKTSFALVLGQLMAADSRVLYVNLEEYSGFSALIKEPVKGDLSDVMYFYRQGNCSSLRISALVHALGNLDYIPPVRCPEDLGAEDSYEMAGLLRAIASEGKYDFLIVDMGHFGKDLMPMLEVCSVIYMPVKEDPVSAAKLEEFDGYLEFSGHGELRERIKRLKLPFHSSLGRKEDYLEQLMWGEMGDYVRNLLRGSKGTLFS